LRQNASQPLTKPNEKMCSKDGQPFLKYKKKIWRQPFSPPKSAGEVVYAPIIFSIPAS